jgi:hypothetical protein
VTGHKILPKPATSVIAASGQGLIATVVGEAFMPASFVPKREFDPIPESKFVKDNAKVIFHDILRGADDFGHLAVFQSLSDEFYNLLLAWAGNPGSVQIAGEYGCVGL